SATSAPLAAPLLPRERPASLPLSFAQQRLWFLDQLAPGQPTYTIPIALRAAGRVDVAALSASLNAVVRRHEVLRTTFAVLDGQPIQLIAPQLCVEVVLTDLSGVAQERRESEAQCLVRAEAGRPFELSRGP